MVDWNSFDEGLGTTYERLMLDHVFEDLARRHRIERVMEAPIFGMTGIDGINSVFWAKQGARVTLVDDDPARTEKVRSVWQYLELADRVDLAAPSAPDRLPFEDHSFDLAWNFAALWHVADPAAWLREMCRVSRGLVAIFVPNRYQIGYLLRKYLLDRPFFTRVHEDWISPQRISKVLCEQGYSITQRGVMDVPPWPDTCVPISSLWRKPGATEAPAPKQSWHWNILRHYREGDPELRARIERLAFLDRLRVPWQLKLCWSHHRYLIAER